MIGLQNEREWTKFCNIVLEMPQLIDDRNSQQTQIVHESSLERCNSVYF